MSVNVFSAAEASIRPALEVIESELKDAETDRKQILKIILSAEELLVQLIRHAESPDAAVIVSVQRKRHVTRIRFTCRGRAFRISDVPKQVDPEGLDDEQAAVVSQLLLQSNADTVRLHNLRGINRAELVIREKDSDGPNPVLISMAVGAVFGLLLRTFAPAAVSDGLSRGLFGPVSDVFFNMVRMVSVPLVFFSLAESVSGFSDFRAFGRIGGRVIGTYLTTSALSMLIGTGLFLLLPVGDPAQRAAVLAVSGASDAVSAADASVLNTILGIVPDNLAGVFLSGNMLQIIFLAVLSGIASGLTGEYVAFVQHFLHSGSRLFGRMAEITMNTLPVAVFCIMANTLMTTDMSSVLSLAKLFGLILLGVLALLATFNLMLAVLCRADPRVFFRKLRRALITAFTTASASATSTITKACLKEMGVSPKVYCFSVPLGSVINSTDNGILFPVLTLFMMRVFGMPIGLDVLPALLLSGYLLGFSTPGLPGAGLAAQAMLFVQFGIPAGAVGYVIPVLTLVDFFCTVSNVTGHAVASVFVANREGLLDREQYARF